ncbi:MAG: hypothetical protein ACKVOR_05395 [Flavobacteriales bacterium]
MKKITTILIACIISTMLNAQAPDQFSYQAIVRDIAGDPVVNTTIGLQFSIHETTAAGPIVYRERFTIATNEFGLVNLNIGTGTVMAGSMTTIDWGADPHHLQIEQDLSGGTAYTNLGTSQLISVPYALHAGSADLETDATLSGTGTATDELQIAQQGATSGEVLKWNGSTWTPQPDDDGCNTLDNSYDCGVAGGGRIIDVDSGPVQLDVEGNDGLHINMNSATVANGIEISAPGNAGGIYVDCPGNNNGLHINKGGDSPAIKLVGITGSDGPGLDIEQHGSGNAGSLHKYIGGTNLSLYNYAGGQGLEVNHSGGTGDCIQVNKAASSNGDGIEINNLGTGEGLQIFQSSDFSAIDVQQTGDASAALFMNTAAVDAPTVDISGNTSSTSANIMQIGLGKVANLMQMNAANPTPAITAGNMGTGHVMKLDQLHPMTMSPALVASHAGKGSAAKFETMNPTSTEPTLDVNNISLGHAIFISSALPANPKFAIEVISSNVGGGLHVDGSHGGTTTLASFEQSAGARVAHFSQSTSGPPITKEVVLISTTNTSPAIPALKVTTPDPSSDFAAEFNGNVEMTGSLVVDGESTLNDDVVVTGNFSATGATDLATTTADDLAVLGETELNGNVTANGNIDVVGTVDANHLDANTVSAAVKMFKIDHPLDPQNKYLQHACVESNEMMNIYTGNVMMNASGEAEVTMPAWFDALNEDCRYQLTCVGGFANIFVKEKMNSGHFVIAGGTAGLEVSWQVTAVRHDEFATQNPLQVEVSKSVKR